MKTKRILSLTSLILISLGTFLSAEDEADSKAPQSPITWKAGSKPTADMDVLFVQNAASVSLKDGKLVLSNVSPATICFTDRPARLAGHMQTSAFIPLWTQGKDSFLKDPPNANLSVLEGEKVIDVVVEISNPVLKDSTLTYDVKVLEGDATVKGGACSLFIDVIGMPRTPVSYAGVARRTTRRVVRRAY